MMTDSQVAFCLCCYMIACLVNIYNMYKLEQSVHSQLRSIMNLYEQRNALTEVRVLELQNQIDELREILNKD